MAGYVCDSIFGFFTTLFLLIFSGQTKVYNIMAIHEQYGYGKIIFSYSYMNNILLKIGNIWLWTVFERQIHKPLSYTRCGSMLALCLVVQKETEKNNSVKQGGVWAATELKAQRSLFSMHTMFL